MKESKGASDILTKNNTVEAQVLHAFHSENSAAIKINERWLKDNQCVFSNLFWLKLLGNVCSPEDWDSAGVQGLSRGELHYHANTITKKSVCNSSPVWCAVEQQTLFTIRSWAPYVYIVTLGCPWLKVSCVSQEVLIKLNIT